MQYFYLYISLALKEIWKDTPYHLTVSCTAEGWSVLFKGDFHFDMFCWGNACRYFILFRNENITYPATLPLQVWNIACNLQFGIQKFIFCIYIIYLVCIYKRVARTAQATPNELHPRFPVVIILLHLLSLSLSCDVYSFYEPFERKLQVYHLQIVLSVFPQNKNTLLFMYTYKHSFRHYKHSILQLAAPTPHHCPFKNSVIQFKKLTLIHYV